MGRGRPKDVWKGVLSGLALVLGLETTHAAEPRERMIFMLDASGSMEEDNRFTRAKTTILNGVDRMEESGGEAGLIVFGGGDCSAIEFKVKPGPGFGRAIREYLANFTPKGRTPIKAALQMARKYIEEHREPKPELVILTDGKDNCVGDEESEINGLKKSGLVKGIDYQWLAPPDEWLEREAPFMHPSAVPRELTFGAKNRTTSAPSQNSSQKAPAASAGNAPAPSAPPVPQPSVAPSAPPAKPSPQPSRAPIQMKPQEHPSDPPEMDSPLL